MKGRPRLFRLTYDATKNMRLREPTRTEEHTLWGTYYPDPYGMVTLSIGAVFERLSEMKEHFGKSGRYVIEWESGERETNA